MQRIGIMICIACSLLLPMATWAATDADAVVIEQTTQLTCKNKDVATVVCKVVYEILNEKGKDFADFSINCSGNEKLTAFSGVVTNAAGKELKKIKKGDLKRTEFSAEAFATDSYSYYYDYTPASYPVKVTYEWTYELKGVLIGFDPFVPQPGLRLQVNHAKYELTAPADMGVRYKIVNLPDSSVREITNGDGTVTLTAEVQQLAPIASEDYSEPASEMLPVVYFAPSDFHYLGTTGNCSTWENFGKWQYALLEGRDVLSDEMKARLHSLTDTCTSERSKIAVVYGLLEQTTRYVSIQLGIGGLQPFPAMEVWRTGFGDCKALTNFMRVMLREVGVKSTYCTINARLRKNFYPDFASVGQSNHVVLCVPEASDSLWIECTDPSLPLGYVHSGIAGHHAMAVDEQGGHLVRLPQYADSLNLQSTKVDVTLQADGSAHLAVELRTEYEQYEDLLPLRIADDRERKEWLLKNFKAPHGVVAAIQVEEQRQPFCVPTMMVCGQIDSQKFANAVGSRLIVPLNPTHRPYSTVPKALNRRGKVYVRAGYRDVDTITIHLPEGFEVEALPGASHFEEAFGEWKMHITTPDARTVVVSTSLTMHQGTYSPDTFAALYEFKKKVKQQLAQFLPIKKM